MPKKRRKTGLCSGMNTNMKKKSFTFFCVLFIYTLGSYTSYAEQLYVEYENDGKNNISLEVGNVEIEFTEDEVPELIYNFTFEKPEDTQRIIFSLKDINPENKIEEVREALLEFGHATLTDESLALDYEIRAQNYAKENKNGIWKNQSPETEGSIETASEVKKESKIKNGLIWIAYHIIICIKWIASFFKGMWTYVSAVLKKIIVYVKDNLIGFLQIILSGGFLGFVLKKIRTKRRTIFIAGATSAGKTELRHILVNPDSPIGTNYNRTVNVDYKRIFRDFQNEKIFLDIKLIDPPGNDLGVIVDNLIKKRIFPYIIVLVLAPTRESTGRVQWGYINEQLNLIQNLWCGLISSKRMKKPLRFILFINKSDIFLNMNLQYYFREHIDSIKQYCNNNSINFRIITGSVYKRNGINEILEIFKQR